MSLNYDLTQCPCHDEIMSDAEWPITDALIWTSMGIGIDRITEDNWKEFFARASFKEKVNGTILFEEDPVTHEKKERFLTPEDVQKRIGMTTNVSNVSLSEFLERAYIDYSAELAEKLDNMPGAPPLSGANSREFTVVMTKPDHEGWEDVIVTHIKAASPGAAMKAAPEAYIRYAYGEDPHDWPWEPKNLAVICVFAGFQNDMAQEAMEEDGNAAL